MVVTLAQVGLGISTLLYHVPVSLGSLHQANALLLMTTVVGLLYTLRVPRHAMQLGGVVSEAVARGEASIAREVAAKAAKPLGKRKKKR
jgi:cytochrome c oxidase assembly protein subunit 15